MGVEGFANEREIASYINGKKFSELNSNMQRFLKYLNDDIGIDSDAVIRTITIGGTFKADLLITFDGKKRYVSMKEGGGNSFHQEKVEFFLDFINTLGASQQVKNCLKDFISSYDDGDVYFSTHENEKLIIQRFFNQHSKILLERFLKTGKYSTNHAEFIYHGTISNGKFRKIDEIIKEMISAHPPGGAQVYVGCLTFQKWNTRNESKRGSIQLKGPSIKNFLV